MLQPNYICKPSLISTGKWTPLSAPKSERHPELISAVLVSTKSQMDVTIWSWTSTSASSRQTRFSNGLKRASLKWKKGCSVVFWSMTPVSFYEFQIQGDNMQDKMHKEQF